MLNDAEKAQPESAAREAERKWYRASFVRLRGTGITGVVVVTAIVYGVVIVGRLAFHHWDPTLFVRAGIVFYDQSGSPATLTIGSHYGYDGQFYYRLALHPLSTERTAYGMRIDNPAYRGQRMLYPVLACLVAFGRPAWIPWSMILVNYLAICWLAASAARFAEHLEVPAFYGLSIPFLPAMVLGLARDLTDPTAASLMVFSLFLVQSRRVASGACVLALAILARETMVVLAGALFLHSVWHSIRKQSPWTDSIAMLIPLATYILLELWTFNRWKEYGSLTALGNLSRVPLTSLISFIAHVARIWDAPSLPSVLYHLFLFTELVFLGETILSAGVAFRRSEVVSEIKLAWLTYLVFAAFFSNRIWVEDWSFMRACQELMVLGLMILIGTRERKWLQIVVASTIAIWMPLALRVVLIP